MYLELAALIPSSESIYTDQVSISFGDLMYLEPRCSEPAPRGRSNHDLRVNRL